MSRRNLLKWLILPVIVICLATANYSLRQQKDWPREIRKSYLTDRRISEDRQLEEMLKNGKNLNRGAIEKIQRQNLEYPFSFAVMGDTHVGDKGSEDVFMKLLDKLKEESPAFLVINGDLTTVGFDGNWDSYLERIKRQPYPVISVRGNHDTGGFGFWEGTFGKEDFSFELKNHKFIFLSDLLGSETHGRIRNDQISWLKSQLETDRYPFIFMHIPTMLPKAQYWHYYGGDYFGGKPALIQNHTEFVRLVETHKIPITLVMSHMHCFADYQRGKTRYLVTGGGGGDGDGNLRWQKEAVPPHDGIFYHFIKITLEKDGSYEGKVFTLDGEDERYGFRNPPLNKSQ